MSFKKQIALMILGLLTAASAWAGSPGEDAWNADKARLAGCPGGDNGVCRCKGLGGDGKGFGQLANTKYCVKTKPENPFVTEDLMGEIAAAQQSIPKGTVESKCETVKGSTQHVLEAMTATKSACDDALKECRKACDEAMAAPNAKSDSELVAANDACTAAGAKSDEMAGDIANIKKAQANNGDCVTDVGTKTAGDGSGGDSGSGQDGQSGQGGGGGMPDLSSLMSALQNKDACSTDPTSQACQQQVQDCTNPTYAATNTVCKCYSATGASDPACSQRQAAQSTVPDTQMNSLNGGGSSMDDSAGGGGVKTNPFAGNPSSGGAGAALAGGGGGGAGLKGMDSANKGSPVQGDDPGGASPNANFLGKAGGGGAGGGGSAAGGGYNENLNWIPGSAKERNPAGQVISVSKRAQLCSPKDSVLRSNFQQISVRAICVMDLEPR